MTHHRSRARTRTRTDLMVHAVAVVVAGVVGLLTLPASWCAPRGGEQRGQSTVEYALILLGAAAIALVVVAWVTRTDAIGRLFDTVIGRVLQQAD